MFPSSIICPRSIAMAAKCPSSFGKNHNRSTTKAKHLFLVRKYGCHGLSNDSCGACFIILSYEMVDYVLRHAIIITHLEIYIWNNGFFKKYHSVSYKNTYFANLKNSRITMIYLSYTRQNQSKKIESFEWGTAGSCEYENKMEGARK